MVANMALPVTQPQHASSRDGEAPDIQPYAWPLRADSSHGMIPSFDESSNSWEARAFAEDASSLAAGIWPPRAYHCSFCRREFRSAQALGGHMNVHRRDRARLRHTSPPLPFSANHNISFQSSSVIHKSQHAYSSSTSPDPSACPDIYPNQSFSKINLLPNALPHSAISPQSTTPSLTVRHPSDLATSFPLRLHLLASEAESTLMLPQVKSSDLLSLWPIPAIDSRNGSHSTVRTGIRGSAMDMSSWSASSSSSSSSSLVLNCAVTPSVDTATCRRARRGVPVIQLDDESRRKKSNVSNDSDFQPNQGMTLKNPSKDADGLSHQHEKQKSDIVDNGEMRIRMQHAWPGTRNKNEYVDLELRLGQRLP